MGTVSFHSEAEFVSWLRRRWPERATGLEVGIGDDAAIVHNRRGQDLVLTTDLSIENIHFRLDLHPPRSVGHRALARSLSDLAAMGAVPRFALLSLVLPRHIPRSWITAFYDGLGALARRFDVLVIGGDTAVTRDPPVVVDLIATGEIKHGRVLRRRGAKPGDHVYVTGRLGMAALGLALLEAGETPTPVRAGAKGGVRSIKRAALRAHLYPEPRCAVGAHLVRHGLGSAAIDISDGFAADLGRLCEVSACGARIRQDRLPLIAPLPARAPSRASRSRENLPFKFDPVESGLHGGEDYEIIFTVQPSKASRLPRTIQGVSVHEVGFITPDRGLQIVTLDGKERTLEPRGFDHFRK